ncbi:hypothetical protein NLI96_g6300 [Meripilus lineatus]|uniref:Uncharacterized protein n=1 Tax=Meripilus lineatus TaxID=2056292 RepID=A0AAD5V3M8_9APHY|nr:hypothetical protein NLI96_g6300 [Physisporinus lineatus]
MANIPQWNQDPNVFLRTRNNFGGRRGLGSNKTQFEEIIHFAAGNPDLRNPQERWWDATTGKIVEHPVAGDVQRDHFFELQFLSALFYQIVPDRATTVVNTLDLEYFFTEICNSGSNLCYISDALHHEKNMLMTNLGTMTAGLLLYLQSCVKDFKAFVDSELNVPGALDGVGTPGHRSMRYFTLLVTLKRTPFYTGQFPAIGQQWWVA